MKKVKNQLYTNILFLIICLFVILSFNGLSILTVSAIAINAQIDLYEEKYYWDGNIEENFSNNSIIVVVDRYNSGVNKEHSDEFFGSFEKTFIKDLTKIQGNIEEKKYLNKEEFRQIFLIGLPVEDKNFVLSAIEELERIPGVLYVGPNYKYQHINSNANIVSRAIITYENYITQWGLERIQANEAKLLVEMEESEKVKVGIIDTGITEHDVLEVTNGRHFFRNIENDVIFDNYTQDDDNHGTMVAGLVAAVCPNVELVPLKVAGFWGNEVIEAINYAIENNIGILNFSGGTDLDINLAFELINYTGLFIASSGNEGPESQLYPSSLNLSNIISVGGTKESSDLCAEASDWEGLEGSCYNVESVDLFAPGTGIISTNNSNAYNYGAYGTSFAAPFVTGTAALILSEYPELTASQIKEVILNNVAIEEGNNRLAGLCVTEGRLNAYKALSNVYKTSNNGTKITGISFTPAGELNIPSAINGVTITSIGSQAFSGCTNLESITIPATITSIGSNAFLNCTNLQSVTFEAGSQLTSIGYNAFASCINLGSIKIPSSVTSISLNARF